MKNRKRTIFILGAVLGGVLLIAAAVCLFMVPTLSVFPAIDLSTLTPDQKRTLDSIEKIDNHPLYTMTYYGDYSQFLKLKDKYYKQLGLPDPRCSTFAALNQDGDAVLGYNSDSGKASYLLLFTNPPVGYKSVSVVHISEAFGIEFARYTRHPSAKGFDVVFTVLYEQHRHERNGILVCGDGGAGFESGAGRPGKGFHEQRRIAALPAGQCENRGRSGWHIGEK